MKVSLNTIRQYIDFELPPVDELVSRINQQLGQVEEVIDLASQYKDVTIVKVISCEKHPDADRLSVCLVDDGGVIADIERDELGYVRVVCGAPNVHEGMFAAWLPPRSIVPSSFGTDEPFVLDARELRGVKSNGMMAAADELALWSDHEGIIEIDPSEWRPTATEIKPGASFAKAFGLDDTIIDIENKMFTHRPDLFGQFGVARELSAIIKGTPSEDDDVDTRFVNPDWYWAKPLFQQGDGSLTLKVVNEVPEMVPRFMTVVLKDVEIKPSPLWLKIELVRLGTKPINNVVDATNYAMLLTSQPTHAYDYDKLRGQTLVVRMAQDGESATLLNGKSYKLTHDDIVIVDGEGVVGLGGVMGGGNSEVSSDTKNIVLEVATFDMYAIRKTSMRHGLFTDAVTRFNKGQSPLQNDRILTKLIALISQQTDAVQASIVHDLPERTNQPDEASLSGEITISTEFVNARLGLSLDARQIGGLLRRVNFASYPKEDDESTLCITAPFWRTDIVLREDIVEEVGRLYGFDKLPLVLPSRSITPTPKNVRRETKQRVREALQRAGANEVLTYSFVHERTITSAGQDVSHAYVLSNALSPQLQYYRLSVLPSLLDKVHMDIKVGFDEFALFEIGKAHTKVDGLDDEGLPKESEFVDLVISRKQALAGAPYYHARHLVEFLLHELGIDAVYNPIDQARGMDSWTPFDLGRSAVVETREGVYIGIVGELSASVRTKYKLPDYTAAMSLSFDAIEMLANAGLASYMPLSRYPSTSQDISLRVDTTVHFDEVLRDVVTATGSQSETLSVEVTPVSIYQADDDTSHKTITLHIEFTSDTQTLKDDDVNPIMDAITSAANKSLGAERV